MNELRNYSYVGDCARPKSFGLLGNLGLKEWMRGALAPASGPNPILSLGYHAAPSSGAKAATPKAPKGGPKVEEADLIQQKIEQLNTTVALVVGYADEAKNYAASARKISQTLKSVDLTKPPQEFLRSMVARRVPPSNPGRV